MHSITLDKMACLSPKNQPTNAYPCNYSISIRYSYCINFNFAGASTIKSIVVVTPLNPVLNNSVVKKIVKLTIVLLITISPLQYYLLPPPLLSSPCSDPWVVRSGGVCHHTTILVVLLEYYPNNGWNCYYYNKN